MIRLSGLAAVLAGVLFAILDLVSFLVLDYEHYSEAASTGAYIVIYSLFLLAAVLLVGGLVGLYAHQSKAAGTFGFVVFVVAFLGSVLLASAIWNQAFLAPSIAKAAP